MAYMDMPADELQEGLPGQTPSMLDAVEGLQEPEIPDFSAEGTQPEGEPQGEQLSVEAIQAELRKLQQRIGTDDDVRTVKSQRDRAKAELDAVQQQVVPYVQQLTQRLQAVEAQREQDDLQAWEGRWTQYLNTVTDPNARQAETARFRSIRDNYLRERELAKREQQVAAQQNQLAQVGQAAQDQAYIDLFKNMVFEVAKEDGIDPNTLDSSTFTALKESYFKAKKSTKSTPAATTPQVPTRPVHGGRPAPSSNIQKFFGDALAAGKFRELDDMFEAASTVPGLTLNDIMRRPLK